MKKTCKCRIIIGLNTVMRFSQNPESGSIFMIVSKQGNPYSGIFSLAKEISNLSSRDALLIILWDAMMLGLLINDGCAISTGWNPQNFSNLKELGFTVFPPLLVRYL